jgi:hypothetical protein
MLGHDECKIVYRSITKLDISFEFREIYIKKDDIVNGLTPKMI